MEGHIDSTNEFMKEMNKYIPTPSILCMGPSAIPMKVNYMRVHTQETQYSTQHEVMKTSVKNKGICSIFTQNVTQP